MHPHQVFCGYLFSNPPHAFAWMVLGSRTSAQLLRDRTRLNAYRASRRESCKVAPLSRELLISYGVAGGFVQPLRGISQAEVPRAAALPGFVCC